jgi:hypothetical protein
MKLADFIDRNREQILLEWEEFAGTILPVTAGFSSVELRDDVKRLLVALALDMRTSQSKDQQQAKAEGRRPWWQPVDGDSPAHSHAQDRFRQGFDLDQMVSEYRALRASVIRLWTREMGGADRAALDELTRFNEAIDEALTESIGSYSRDLERSRELLLGVLGHDLRSPLGAVLLSATYLVRSEGLSSNASKAASRIFASATRMATMVSDLLDFARTRSGQLLPVERSAMDLVEVCRQSIAEAEAFHPAAVFQLQAVDTLPGEWDRERIAQLLSNLLGNAVHHGSVAGAVSVALAGTDSDVSIAVHNDGPPIPEDERRKIFQPMVQGSGGQEPSSASGLGLGLFIVREIVYAHGGTISLESSAESGTTFAVTLPRRKS